MPAHRLETLRSDLFYGVRTLRASPAFAITSILTLALGIGGATAMFTVIRSAPGAQKGDILRLVIGRGLALSVAGAGAGLAGALALTGVMKSLLFQLSPTDPLTFASVPTLFVAAAAAASYFPARRAASIDPMAALK